MSEYRPLRHLTDAELQAQYEAAIAIKQTAWAAWEAVRDINQLNLHCAEWQAVNTANRVLGGICSEQGFRQFDRALAMQYAPWETPDMDKAWIEGPGSEAL